MRNLKKAAFAGATAVAVAFGTTAVATAATPDNPDNFSHVRTHDSAVDGSTPGDNLPAKIGHKVEATDSKGNPTGVEWNEFSGNWDQNGTKTPVWAKIAFVGGIFAAVSAFVGLIVGPAYNYVVHGPHA